MFFRFPFLWFPEISMLIESFFVHRNFLRKKFDGTRNEIRKQFFCANRIRASVLQTSIDNVFRFHEITVNQFHALKHRKYASTKNIGFSPSQFYLPCSKIFCNSLSLYRVVSSLSKFLNTAIIRFCACGLSNTVQQSYDVPPLTAQTAHHAIKFGGLTVPSKYSTSYVLDNASMSPSRIERPAHIRDTATTACANHTFGASLHNSHSILTARQHDSKSPNPAS